MSASVSTGSARGWRRSSHSARSASSPTTTGASAVIPRSQSGCTLGASSTRPVSDLAAIACSWVTEPPK